MENSNEIGTTKHMVQDRDETIRETKQLYKLIDAYDMVRGIVGMTREQIHQQDLLAEGRHARKETYVKNMQEINHDFHSITNVR